MKNFILLFCIFDIGNLAVLFYEEKKNPQITLMTVSFWTILSVYIRDICNMNTNYLGKKNDSLIKYFPFNSW